MRLDKGSWAKGVVEWQEGGYGSEPLVVCLSVAFTWHLPAARERALFWRDRNVPVRVGGSGAFVRGAKFLGDVAEVGGSIPDAIARHNPQATRASYGCPEACWFCIVSKKDGRAFTLVPDFVPRPVLCDDNLSALPIDFQRHIVRRYSETGVPLLDANSGFAPSTFTEETRELWAPVLKGPWRFAYDEVSEGREVERVFGVLKAYSPRRKQVYTMIGHEPVATCMDRIKRVIAWGGEPYAQPFIKLNALEKSPDPRHDWTPDLLRAVQRWVNRRLWRPNACPDFADYRASIKTRRPAPGQTELFGPPVASSRPA